MEPEAKKSEIIQNSSNTQMSDNVLAAVATIPLIGLIIYYAMPNASAFVKYYAKHGIGLLAAYLVVFVISFFVWGLGSLLDLVLFVLWIILVVNALQNKMYRMPVLTDLVEKYVK